MYQTLSKILFGFACSPIFMLSGAEAADSITPQSLADSVATAFGETHDGWSSDEVLLNPELNRKFISRCLELLPDAMESQCNQTLLNLRKRNKLNFKVTKRKRQKHDAYRHAAEISARLVTDKHRVTTDQMFCDPKIRAEFDKSARQIAPHVDVYRLRKAAFGLRKSRRLRPELVVRVADWGRDITELTAKAATEDASLVPSKPGIYLLRDASGYLYIGEAIDLRKRIAQHLSQSDNDALAKYLKNAGIEEIAIEIQAFEADSPARKAAMRRAYESELIASRKPRFNIRP